MKILTVDGARGEGGGQILRTSLALSLITGRPVHFVNIRAGRSRPGLLRQHLTGLRAAAAVGAARVTGDALGSREVIFRPGGPPRGGEYRFAVGSAGSAGLVLQTVLPALLGADAPSELVIEGGTHNMSSPPHGFLARAFLPLLARMGARVELTLERAGFYPAGGGRYRVAITPSTLSPLAIPDPSGPPALSARALISLIPTSVGQRELQELGRRLPLAGTELREVRSPGPGNALSLDATGEHLTEVFTAFGRKGVPAQQVARGLAREVRAYLDSGAAVGRHLADQLLLPMALAGGGTFSSQRPSAHTTTNIETIRAFLDVEIRAEPSGPDRCVIQVRG